ncbi:MAG: hypothetical protein ACFB4J_17155, partial [Elainellaceae cyanobacterium]
ASLPNAQSSAKPHPSRNWWGKFVATVAVVNLAIALFNVSYLPLRNLYLRYIPAVVTAYDPVKGIEPHPITFQYIKTVDVLDQQVSSSESLGTAEVANMLTSLRQQSVALVEENPFASAGQFSTFGKLKRRIRDITEEGNAQDAFRTFWSADFLDQIGWPAAYQLFQTRLEPLLARNYFRNTDDNGRIVDRFWYLDLWFGAFFGAEFLRQAFVASLRQPGISWLDAMLRRWYDLLLLIPFWRWLRIVPVSVRLNQSGLVNMERVIQQVTHEPAAYLSERVATFALVRLINQAKESVETGALVQSLLGGEKPYIQVSDVDKVDALSDRLLDIAIYRVLPQVKPDVRALLRHSIQGAVKESDFYRGIQQVPGLDNVPEAAILDLSDYLAQQTYEVLVESYSDQEGRVLFDQLAQGFREAFLQEIQDVKTQRELQNLLAGLLEEVKLNYVQGTKDNDPEATLAEADQLKEALMTPSNVSPQPQSVAQDAASQDT